MDSDYGLQRKLSDLQKQRSTYLPLLPPSLQGTSVRVECGDATTAADPSDAQIMGQLFPHTYGQPLVRFLKDSAESSSTSSSAPMRVGVVFCGRQSPGGHNVIWGIHNALKTHNPNSVLLGFLGGSEGLFAQRTLEITDDILSTYKNQGGYDLLGRTKDQIRTIEQVNASMAACTSLNLDGLVIIGGVTSNTDAAQLAETFVEAKCPTKVVGVPVTLNGDLKNQFVETNVGFDTICKVNSQLISNVCTDALSAEKYYYFIRLMGRKASHVALECTLQSHPNMVILGEEVSASKRTLSDLTKQICDAVQARAEKDKFHGVILLPEDLIESIPEVYALLQEIHGLLEQGVAVDMISSQLSPSVSALFEFLPPFLRNQLLLIPESDDSAQLSQIEIEKLLAHLVDIEMNKRSKEGTYKGKKFNAICHFFGYQARGSLPSKFDCDYAFVLGHLCYHILAAGLTGYLATLSNLKNPVDEWRCGAAPITAMMTVKRFGCGLGASSPGKPALHPAIVDLKSKSYELLRQNVTKFLMDDVYRNLGPLQFDGPAADSKPTTLCIEDQNCMGCIKEEVEVDQVKCETSSPLVVEVDIQNTTDAAAETGDVSQSHDQEEAISSEQMTVSETRLEDKVPEADEYVLIDSKDCFPTSKPEEAALVTKDPSDCLIQDAAVLNDSDENDNSIRSTGDSIKSESNGGDLLCPVNSAAEAADKATLVKYPCDCRIEDAAIQTGSSEIDTNFHSLGNFMNQETEGGDVLHLVSNAAEAEEEASVTVYPCDCRIEYSALQSDCRIQDAALQSDCRIQDAALQNSFENDNNLQSPGDSIKLETEEGELLHPVSDAAEAEEKEEAVVQNDSFENSNKLHSLGDFIKKETKADDLLCPLNIVAEAEEEEKVSVTKYPCDCRFQDAALQSSFENNNNLHSPGDFIKPETEGGDLLHSVTNAVEAEEKEEALVTKYPCDCRIQDAAVQNDSFDNDNKLHSLGDFIKPDIKADDLSCPEAEEEEEASVTKYPCDCRIQDAAVQKDSSGNDNNLHSSGVIITPKTVGIELSYPVNNITEADEEEKAVVTMDPSDCDIQDASSQKDSYENPNNLHSPDNFMTSEANGDEHLCPVSNTVKAEEDEEGSVTKNPSDNLIQDAAVRIHSSENEDNLHSPDEYVKSETEGGDLLCCVNNDVAVELEGTKASNEVNEISKVTKISGSSCTDANTEACSHSLAAGVLIPEVSCHANGGLVHVVARSSVADMISVSEIHNSSTNGINISCTDAAVISQVPVQFGSFVPAIYQGNGVCGDDLSKVSCQEVKDYEQVRKSDVSKLPSSPKGFSAHPEVEQVVAVESVERPFNFLIRIPKYYDEELNEQVRQAELQVDEKTQKREGIKFKMQVIRGNLQQARSDYTARLSEERAARRLVRLKRQEIDSVQSIINRVKNAISVEDIDSRIKHMEHMMQHETLPLKEEKQFIREIKQLKLYREQLSTNMGSQDEVRQAIDQRDQIEEQLKTLKKDLDRLKHNVSTAEATVVAADTKLKEEKKRIEELYAQHGTAQNARQEAYMNMQNLRRQFYEKNARFRTYKDDTTAAYDYASSGNKGALHRLCLNQVENLMELWNKDDEFRKEYIRCNARSTMWRLRTMDGRALGPDEELPVVTSFVDERIRSSRYRGGQVNPELPLVTADLDKREEPLPTTEAADLTEVKSVEKVAEQINKAEKAKMSGNPAMKNNSLPINSVVESVETLEEVSNKKQTKEEQEVARKEEQSRKAEEEAKLKEQRRLEEIAKAKEALERKRKIAEKAQIRAEVRAQKEAEQKDKEKEKRAKKKERKKAGVGGDEGGDSIVPASDLTVMTTVKESETKEVHPPAVATASKRHQKAFIKQQNKIKSASSMPAPLRNKHKKRMQQWIWIGVTALLVLALVLLCNMGFYPNHLGRNRHPGF